MPDLRFSRPDGTYAQHAFSDVQSLWTVLSRLVQVAPADCKWEVVD